MTLASIMAVLVVLVLRHEQLLTVQSASMIPAFMPGDALVVRPVPFHAIRPGDVVSYHDTRNSMVIVSHRVLRIDRRHRALVTAGDAYKTSDSVIAADAVIGRAVAVAPRLGYVINAMRAPAGLLVAVYVPATVVVGFEVCRFLQARRTILYQDPQVASR
jgi:signal peptidase I